MALSFFAWTPRRRFQTLGMIALLLTASLIPACPIGDMSVTSEYGMRTHPLSGRRKLHAGIDYAAPKGTDVRSIFSGTVVRSKNRGGFGRFVVIRSGRVNVLYAHLSRRDVRVGDRIEAGQQVGLVGSSGASTGPHLHLGMYKGGRAKNPSALMWNCRVTE